MSHGASLVVQRLKCLCETDPVFWLTSSEEQRTYVGSGTVEGSGCDFFDSNFEDS